MTTRDQKKDCPECTDEAPCLVCAMGETDRDDINRDLDRDPDMGAFDDVVDDDDSPSELHFVTGSR